MASKEVAEFAPVKEESNQSGEATAVSVEATEFGKGSWGWYHGCPAVITGIESVIIVNEIGNRVKEPRWNLLVFEDRPQTPDDPNPRFMRHVEQRFLTADEKSSLAVIGVTS